MSKATVSSIPIPNALVKPKREGLKKIEAVSIKPPSVSADTDGGDNHTYVCRYVSADFKEIKQPCTFDVWKRCEGRQIPGKVRDGLDARLDNDFVLIQNADGVIVDIDVLPKTYYSSRAVLPDYLQDKHDIVLKINTKTGGVEVLQCPAGVTKPSVRKLVNALDAIDTIQTGDSIPGGFEVLNVSGNQISVVPVGRN